VDPQTCNGISSVDFSLVIAQYFCFFKLALQGRVGTGKKATFAVDPSGTQCILKYIDWEELLFATSVKRAQQREPAHSWLFSVDLSALKEYAFMKAL
jgi:RIO-like serine/threonine protein kinase